MPDNRCPGKVADVNAKLKWADLTTAQRGSAAAAGALHVGLAAWMNRDLSRRSDDEVRGPKLLWRAASFVNFAGPISYFLIGRRRT